MKPMVYIKQTACADLSLQEFTAQWKECGPVGQNTLRTWALEEMGLLGIESS